jgi:N-acetyl-gamma-glutamyl-phosphate reductase
MIESFENGSGGPFEVYGLALKHKHLPEIVKYGGLVRRPIFIPSVGNFAQGMLVELPLFLDELPRQPKLADLHEALAAHYRGSEWISVEPPTEGGRIEATALNGTNRMELRVYGNEDTRQAVLVARLDNLGKGASGAAVQNLKLMLGI